MKFNQGKFGRTLSLWMTLTVGLVSSLPIESAPEEVTQVHFHLIDSETDSVTPAMICITGASGEVRLPPDGRIMESVSMTDDFYEGCEFDPDPNWIGPVRMMRGKGDNDDRSYVYKELLSIPYWNEPVMYQVSGDFSIRLPKGTWRIAVDHGMEYVPVFEEFTTDGEEELHKTIHLKRWINMPDRGWWSGDVHVHHPTTLQTHRDFLLTYAHAVDLHVVNTLEMGNHTKTEFKQEGFGQEFRVVKNNYAIVAGQEDPRSTFGHIIGLNIQGMVRDVETYDFYDIAFDGLHEQPGALAGFGHFAWNGCDLPRGFPWYVTTEALDFIELLQFSLVNTTDYYDYLNLGFRLTAAAGSDIPWGSSMGEVRTYVYTGKEFNLDAWFEGLRKGNTFVSNGPILEFTVDGELPGSELKKESGDTTNIRVVALCHPEIGLLDKVTVMGSDGVIKEITDPEESSELTLECEQSIERSQWITASAVCSNGAVAHTTPIYITVNEQPTWNSEAGPATIQKQMESIDLIGSEFSENGDLREIGIHERLTKARQYYRQMLKDMGQ